MAYLHRLITWQVYEHLWNPQFVGVVLSPVVDQADTETFKLLVTLATFSPVIIGRALDPWKRFVFSSFSWPRELRPHTAAQSTRLWCKWPIKHK